MTTDIKESRTYTTIKPFFKFLNIPQEKPKTILSGTVKKDKALSTNALEEMSNDPHMQALLNDPEIKKAIEDKNYTALLSNPKIMQMAQDPEFVKKLLAAYAQIQDSPSLSNGLKTIP